MQMVSGRWDNKKFSGQMVLSLRLTNSTISSTKWFIWATASSNAFLRDMGIGD